MLVTQNEMKAEVLEAVEFEGLADYSENEEAEREDEHIAADKPAEHEEEFSFKKELDPEVIGFIIGLGVLFIPMCHVMGVSNFLSSLMNTAFDLLLNTCFYIMAIAVVTGAFAGILSEFGVISVLNRVLSPLMKPLFGMPGAAALGAITTYLSDNPAILPLAEDKNFIRYFKRYQLPALTNLGTAFGMGLIVSTFMLGLSGMAGTSLAPAVAVGNLCAVIGCIISTRIMLIFTARYFGKTDNMLSDAELAKFSGTDNSVPLRRVRTGSAASRVMCALLDGGKSGVDLGMTLIPGVLIISTLVLMLTKGTGAEGLYTGAAYEGVAFLPWLADKIEFILKPLFGFSSTQAISVPITAMGSAGASLSLVTPLLRDHLIGSKDIAVFTSMCMCWSGYLSTHVSMMDGLRCKNLIGSAILAHTIGGICAGTAANLICSLAGIG